MTEQVRACPVPRSVTLLSVCKLHGQRDQQPDASGTPWHGLQPKPEP